MKVSIIVPIYNVEKYLCRCIESLLVQTYRDIEIILVDDGSPDGCPELCDEYAEKDTRIRVIHKKNGGLADARNCGIEVALGEYIYFVDSDDHIEPDAVENMVAAMQTENVDLVMSSYYIDYANEGYSVECNIPKRMVFKGREKLPSAIAEMEKISFNVVWNKLYRAELIKKNSLRFQKDGMPGEDLLFNCGYMMLEPDAVLIPEKTYHYMRQDEDSLAGKYRRDLYDKVRRFNRAREGLYEHFDMNSEEYREIYATTFVDYVFSCIPNLYKPQNKASSKEKKEELCKILATEGLSYNLRLIKNKTTYQRLMGLLCSLKKTFIPKLVLDMLFFVRYRSERAYKMARKQIVKGNGK